MQGVKQPGRRQKQAEDDESRRAALQRQQRRERDRDLERVRDRVKHEREAFGGCYAPVLEAMLQPLPKQASALLLKLVQPSPRLYANLLKMPALEPLIAQL